MPRPKLPELRYVRAPEPIVFPEEEEVPEGLPHLLARTFLFQLLRFALGPAHSVGSDQFVYWLATNPNRKLAPDVFVRLHVPQTPFGSWKTWEQGGPPDLAVEIVSPDEGGTKALPWVEKLARYAEVGVKELVRFDPQAAAGERLRAWDRVREDLLERVIADDRTPCLALGLNWVVCPIDSPGESGGALAARLPVESSSERTGVMPARRPHEGETLGLRLQDDEGRWLETELEVAGARVRAEAKARESAEARVRELEEQLRRGRE
jgi:Uma2 family endonuclease